MAGNVQVQTWMRVSVNSLGLECPKETTDLEIIIDRESQTYLREDDRALVRKGERTILLNASYLVDHPGLRSITYRYFYVKYSTPTGRGIYNELVYAKKDLTQILLSTIEGQKFAIKKGLKDAEQLALPTVEFLATVEQKLSERYEKQIVKTFQVFNRALELCQKLMKSPATQAKGGEGLRLLLQEVRMDELLCARDFSSQISLIGSADAMETYYQVQNCKIEAVVKKIGIITEKL